MILTTTLVRAVIDETLRLFPPVPLNHRQCRPVGCCTLPKPDLTFPVESDKPLYMPKGTSFFYSTLLMQRNKELWGRDADNFDPERWIDPSRRSRYTSNPLMFTPFSAGPRIVSVTLFSKNVTFAFASPPFYPPLHYGRRVSLLRWPRDGCIDKDDWFSARSNLDLDCAHCPICDGFRVCLRTQRMNVPHICVPIISPATVCAFPMLFIMPYHRHAYANIYPLYSAWAKTMLITKHPTFSYG